ncbi:MAG: aminotransferase class I/II-fold pyridoxal phosphate-dependent enzyme [Pseudomonadota bacterium]
MLTEEDRRRELALLSQALETLSRGFETLPEFNRDTQWSETARAVIAAAERMQDNFPYAHPFYAGQMLKPPHPVARVAYQMAMWINPNNHALDGGRASSALEKEAVAQLADMYALAPFLGHLTSSGTLANLEALWIAGQEHPGKAIVASTDSHYTHNRLCKVLGLGFDAIETEHDGRMSLSALEARLSEGDVGTIVATLGTTGFGAVDPLPEILELARRFGARVHIDGAYGGYFKLCDGLPSSSTAAYAAMSEADSIAVDPHKHGLQPYGCGCILFADPSLGRHYKHDSPYTYFSSDELHLGEISLECSRAGAAAVALWATQQAQPLVEGGEFATNLNRCHSAAKMLAAHVEADPDAALITEPMLDIVVWALAPTKTMTASQLAQAVFDIAATLDLHLAVIAVPSERLPVSYRVAGEPTVTCLRSCLMKPEHEEAMPRIIDLLTSATSAARNKGE